MMLFIAYFNSLRVYNFFSFSHTTRWCCCHCFITFLYLYFLHILKTNLSKVQPSIYFYHCVIVFCERASSMQNILYNALILLNRQINNCKHMRSKGTKNIENVHKIRHSVPVRASCYYTVLDHLIHWHRMWNLPFFLLNNSFATCIL